MELLFSFAPANFISYLCEELCSIEVGLQDREAGGIECPLSSLRQPACFLAAIVPCVLREVFK